MDLQELESDCLTCNWQVGADYLSVQNSSISNVLRKHFWFTDTEFQGAVVCRTCWDQVNQFHQFYISVKKLHRNRQTSVIDTFESERLQNTHLEMSTSELGGRIQEQQCSVKVKEETFVDVFDDNEFSDMNSSEQIKANDSNDSDKVQRVLKKKTFAERKVRQREYRSQRRKEQDQLEEDCIKEHFNNICTHCGKESTCFAVHLRHSMKEHGFNFVECCGKKFFTKSRLYQHVQFVNNPDCFRCTQCGKSCVHSSGLLLHMKEIHAIGDERKFKCDHCPRTFVLASYLKRHSKSHLPKLQQRVYSCKACPSKFSNVRLLRDHIAAVHDCISPDMLPTCLGCGKAFYSNSSLYKHRKSRCKAPTQGQMLHRRKYR